MDFPAARWRSFPSLPDARWQLYALLAVIAAFQLATIRAGHAPGDDFALYILHARALLEGRAYSDTGFIYHTANAWFSPRVYPPGFPVLLLPLYAMFGVNLAVMKLLVVGFFVGALALTAQLLRPLVPAGFTLAAVALLGFQPYLTEFKNHVLPDLPFMFLVLLALLLMQRLELAEIAHGRALARGLLTGLVACYATAVRTIGVALFGGLLLAMLVRRKPKLGEIACLLTAVLLFAVLRTMMPPGSGYLKQVTDLAGGEGLLSMLPDAAKARALAGETYHFWQGLPPVLNRLVKLSVLLLAALGFAARLRRFSAMEGFVLAYGAAVFLYPALNVRYLIPLLPFLVIYGTLAAARLARRFGRPALAAAVALAVILGVGYGTALAHADYGPLTGGTSSPARSALFAHLESCTSPGDRILFRKSRALTLYTRRPGLTYPRDQNTDLPAFFAALQVGYAATSNGDWVDAALRQPGAGMTPVFRNQEFTLYRNDRLVPRPVPSAACAGAGAR